MAARPTGTVTFLFTDIQGSTRLWEENPGTMRAALARHDMLLRQAIHGHDGFIVKHQGDGFYAAFSTPRDAIKATLEAQHALSTEQWNETGPVHVRMAIHTGTAEERDGDYFGAAVNRAARLVDAGNGGQILVSGATAHLARDDLPDGVSFRDLGDHRLRDLSQPEHIFQLIAPSLPVDFPALRTLSARPNNLPVQSTTFVGREQDLQEVGRLLERSRLISLIGTGGVGKTRLALEVAAFALDTCVDGVWFVELAPLTDPDLLPHTIANTLAIPERQGEQVEDTLLDALRDKNVLLVLDNCEHLIDACARLATLLLRTCPKTRILATSREPLRIPEEVRWHVQPLSVPSAEAPAGPDQLGDYDSVRLFVDRASAIQPGFSLTGQSGFWISEIVRHLDGIPLAIELAAARVSVFALEQIARRLDDRLHLLRQGSRTALPRQHTLEALIEWSYKLLNIQEQLLFQRLSVFAGTFSISAVEVVCSGEGVDEFEVVDLLTDLVEKSLVVADAFDSEFRYRLLESLRVYAIQQLRINGNEPALRRRHANYFLSIAEVAKPDIFTDDQGDWATRLRAESDNFRAVLEWSQAGDVVTGLRLARALWRVWWISGQISEGRAQLERLWSMTDEQISYELRLEVLHALGNLTFRDGDYIVARRYFDTMRRLAREKGDLKYRVMADSALGGMLVEQMDYEPAAQLLRESLELESALPDIPANPYIRIDLGLIELGRGDYDEARRLFQESLDRAEQDHDQLRIAIAHCCLGLSAFADGNVGTARAQFELSLKLSLTGHFEWMTPVVLDGFAAVAVTEKRLPRAVRIASAAAKLRESTGVPLAPLWHRLLGPPLDDAKQQLAPETWATCWMEGRALSLDEAVRYTLEDPGSLSA